MTWMHTGYPNIILYAAFTSVSQLVEHYHQQQHSSRTTVQKPGKSKKPSKLETLRKFSVCINCLMTVFSHMPCF